MSKQRLLGLVLQQMLVMMLVMRGWETMPVGEMQQEMRMEAAD